MFKKIPFLYKGKSLSLILVQYIFTLSIIIWVLKCQIQLPADKFRKEINVVNYKSGASYGELDLPSPESLLDTIFSCYIYKGHILVTILRFCC